MGVLQHALELPDFVAGTHDVATLEANLLDSSATEPDQKLVAAARAALAGRAHPGNTADIDPFRAAGAWRQHGLRDEAFTSAARAVTAGPDDGAARLHVAERGDRLWFASAGITYDVPRSPIASLAAAAGVDDHGQSAALHAPMPGTVIQALEVGTDVSAGQAIVVLEAMKMESSISAPFAGRVERLDVRVGDLVAKGAVLAEVTR
jgi:biotin carboxyl carrier protein